MAPGFEPGISGSAVDYSLINNVNKSIMLIFLSHIDVNLAIGLNGYKWINLEFQMLAARHHKGDHEQ